MEKHSVTVVIADDHPIFIEGLKAVMERSKKLQYDIVGEARTGLECIRLLDEKQPDLLILDMNMPEMDGLEVLEFIRKNNVETNTLALTAYADKRIIKNAFKEGLDGYLLKQDLSSDLFLALESIIRGGTYTGKGVRMDTETETARQRAYRDNFVEKFNLTRREMEVLKLISQALSNKEIAKALYISDQTVSVHRKNIMRKLGVSNTAGLVRLAYDHSLV